jgi:hypothetical protein
VLQQRRNKFADADTPVVILLEETVRTVDGAGRSCLAVHQIRMARNEAGAEQIAREVHPYRKAGQKIHLVLARSIQSDGTSQPVNDEGAFLQSPQYAAAEALYSDYGELVIVFPNVKPQTITESIVVHDEQETRIPGEFTALILFDNNWPQMRVRHTVELDERIAQRLSITPVGEAVPTVVRDFAAHRVRLTWACETVPKRRRESGRAPPGQIGPCVWLSTLKDWTQFGAWYAELLKDRIETRP